MCHKERFEGDVVFLRGCKEGCFEQNGMKEEHVRGLPAVNSCHFY